MLLDHKAISKKSGRNEIIVSGSVTQAWLTSAGKLKDMLSRHFKNSVIIQVTYNNYCKIVIDFLIVF